MTIKRHSDYRPPLFSHSLKEKLKDYRNRIKYSSLKNSYVFMHIPKAGGSYLKRLLSKYLDIHVSDSHEKKLIHFAPNQNLIIPVRDPVSRFESAFYSNLHKYKSLSVQRKVFYDKYPDVNTYVNALSKDPKSILDFSYSDPGYAMVGRFSTLYYWLHSTRLVAQKASQIYGVIRTEHMMKDVIDILEGLNVTYDPKDFESVPKEGKPLDVFPSLSEHNTKFLKQFLSAEYDIANTLLALKAKPRYE